MASIFDSSTLTVVIQETIKLNNNDYGSRTEINLGKINEVSQRVLTVPTHKVSILTLSSSNGAGTYASGSLQYARITNLDNTNHVRLTFMSSSGGTTKNKCVFRLDPKKSFIITNDAYSGSGTGTTWDAFQSFSDIKAIASSSAVDVEVFVAST